MQANHQRRVSYQRLGLTIVVYATILYCSWLYYMAAPLSVVTRPNKRWPDTDRISLPSISVLSRQPFINTSTPCDMADPSTASLLQKAKCRRNGFNDPVGPAANWDDAVDFVKLKNGWSAVRFDLDQREFGLDRVEEYVLAQVFYQWNSSVTADWFGGQVFGPAVYVGLHSKATSLEEPHTLNSMKAIGAGTRSFLKLRRVVTRRGLWLPFHFSETISWQLYDDTLPSLNIDQCDVGLHNATAGVCCMDMQLSLQDDTETRHQPVTVVQVVTNSLWWMWWLVFLLAMANVNLAVEAQPHRQFVIESAWTQLATSCWMAVTKPLVTAHAYLQAKLRRGPIRLHEESESTSNTSGLTQPWPSEPLANGSDEVAHLSTST
jgi:hypothetical protein